jgi:hypothetical protein
VLAVYIVGDCMMTCKVGFLPQHLAVRADAYDGLYARIVSIYSGCCTNVLNQRNFGETRVVALLTCLAIIRCFQFNCL